MKGEGSSKNGRPSSIRSLGNIEYQRLTHAQTQKLEELFKESRHPDSKQQFQVAQELDIDSERIKYWFQNRRTQMKVVHERVSNIALQKENQYIRQENLFLKKAIENPLCTPCLLPNTGETTQLSSTKVLLEIENGKLSLKLHCLQSQLGIVDDKAIRDDKLVMLGIGVGAIDEVTKLLKFNEPLWVKNPGGRYELDHESYSKIFPRPGLENFEGFIESSKREGVVRMPAKQLVDIILDTGKWGEYFSTLIIRAETIREFSSGTTDTRDGCLQLIYAKLHILSHLVGARCLFFVRYCRQISEGIWVIANATDEYFFCTKQNRSPTWCWTLPSGCMIQDMGNGFSKVTWMEHSKFKEHVTSHPLYKDYVNRKSAYGAERWLTTLNRTTERLLYSLSPLQPKHMLGGLSYDGRKAIMGLSQRMVKRFCESISTNSTVEFPDISNSDDSGVQISFHNKLIGQSNIIITTAMESFWLSEPFETVFGYLIEIEKRPQWDVLCDGLTLKATISLPSGNICANRITVLQPQMPVPNGGNFAILQETYKGPLGCFVVYASVRPEIISNLLCTGQEPIHSLELLHPSGFVISPDGYFGNGSRNTGSSSVIGSNCSLITMVHQVPFFESFNIQAVERTKTVARTATQSIKKALGCDDLDP